MKKLIILLLALPLISKGQNQVNLNIKKTATHVIVAGGLIVLGSLVAINSASAKTPSFPSGAVNETSMSHYNADVNSYNKRQKDNKIISSGCYGLGGLFLVVAGNSLIKKSKSNKVAKLKPTADGVSLVFNIK